MIVYVLVEDDGYDYTGIRGVASSKDKSLAWVIGQESLRKLPYGDPRRHSAYMNFTVQEHEVDEFEKQQTKELE
jgi:hypothetical protein